MTCARCFLLLMIIVLTVTACGPRVTDIPTIAETATPALPALDETVSPTPATRSLTVCLGEEPSTLYPYGNLNAAARSVLSAIYDGPIDVVEYGYEPIILEKIPNLDDGDAQVTPVSVRAGEQVVDSSGNLVALDKGTLVRPSDCRSDECAIRYDGSSTIQMDQLVVTFSMLEDLMWSDGEPITANDSVFSYQLAADAPGSKYVIDRTAIYEAADDYTIQWWGKPGFLDPDFFMNFWMPLPQHAWGELPPADLPKLDISSRMPIGWGPYIIDEWEASEQLHFVKNLNYFRAESGLPEFDELTFLIQPDADSALSALVDGTCDVLDPSLRLDAHVGLLQQMEKDNQAHLFVAQTMNMEWLGLGIVPASYDNGYSTSNREDRPDIFGDKRMRQALALCLDRQRVVDTVLFGLSQVPDVYLPADHPLHNGNIQTYTFNPEAGSQILEDVGWLDDDNDPTTPRRASNVTRVPVGTPLVLDYFTSTASQRHQVVDIFTESLGRCGIELNPIYMTADDFYAQGPAGPLFGRKFDLAAYSIGANSLTPQCEWFTSSQIPAESNDWAGTNVTGYKSTQFDQACLGTSLTLPGDPEYSLHQEAQSIFAADLPAIPLYVRLKVAATRPDFCGFTLDPSSSSALNDIEVFDYGESCGSR